MQFLCFPTFSIVIEWTLGFLVYVDLNIDENQKGVLGAWTKRRVLDVGPKIIMFRLLEMEVIIRQCKINKNMPGPSG